MFQLFWGFGYSIYGKASTFYVYVGVCIWTWVWDWLRIWLGMSHWQFVGILNLCKRKSSYKCIYELLIKSLASKALPRKVLESTYGWEAPPSHYKCMCSCACNWVRSKCVVGLWTRSSSVMISLQKKEPHSKASFSCTWDQYMPSKCPTNLCYQQPQSSYYSINVQFAN